jgi:DNA-binding NarL/FixJ family response regulator
MTDKICEENFICDTFIEGDIEDIYVVVLDDSETLPEQIEDFINTELKWKVIISQNREDAVRHCLNKKAVFYILDINLGRGREKEGIDTAEEIRSVDKDVFISILSALESEKKMCEKIKVNYFRKKSGELREDVCNIAVEMLRFQKKLLNDILENCFRSDVEINKMKAEKIFGKIQEIDQKLEDIQKLERGYLLDNRQDNLKYNPELFRRIDEDKNIQAYESHKQDPKWRKEYQNQYVAFADGKLLKDFVDDNLEVLLNQLRNSEHKGKSIFYKKVPKNNIVDTQGSDKFIEEEEFYELPMSLYDFYPSEDEV